MTVGQILDRTFRLYKQNFARFLAIVAIIHVPCNLLMTLFALFFSPQFGPGRSAPPTNEELVGIFAASIMFLVVAVVFAIIAAQLSQGALTSSVSGSYLGNDVTVGQAYRRAWPRLISLIAAAVLVSLAVGIGSLLCIVPGVILALWFALTIPVIIVEGKPAVRAMSRSRQLVSGNLGRTFGLGLVMFLIAAVISSTLSVLGLGASMLVPQSNLMARQIIQQVFQLVGGVIVGPLAPIAYILLYYDLRIRKEAFDLAMLAQSMGSPEATDEVPTQSPL